MRPFFQLVVIALVLSAICDQSEAFKKKKKIPIFKNGNGDNNCGESASPCQQLDAHPAYQSQVVAPQVVRRPVYQSQVVVPQVVRQPAPVRAVAPVVAPAAASSPVVAKKKVPKKVAKKAAKKAVKKAPMIKKLLKKFAKLGKFGGAVGQQEEENCDEQISQPRYVERSVQYSQPAMSLVKKPAGQAAARPFGMPSEQKTSL